MEHKKFAITFLLKMPFTLFLQKKTARNHGLLIGILTKNAILLSAFFRKLNGLEESVPVTTRLMPLSLPSFILLLFLFC